VLSGFVVIFSLFFVFPCFFLSFASSLLLFVPIRGKPKKALVEIEKRPVFMCFLLEVFTRPFPDIPSNLC